MRRLQIKDAISAAKAFVQAGRGNTAPEAEIKRRADICLDCPKRRVARVASRDGASKILGLMANKNKVPRALSGYKCGVCRCSLLLLIPARAEDLHKDDPDQAAERPANCWIKALD